VSCLHDSQLSVPCAKKQKIANLTMKSLDFAFLEIKDPRETRKLNPVIGDHPAEPLRNL